MPSTSAILDILKKDEASILSEWLNYQLASTSLRRDLVDDATLREQSRRFLEALRAGLQRDGGTDVHSTAGEDARRDARATCRAPRAAGVLADETATLRVLAEAAAVRAPAQGSRADAGGARDEHLAGDAPCSTRSASTRPRCYQKGRESVIVAPAAGDARAVDAGRRALGRHPRAAAHRHARQRAHAGRHGEPARSASSTPAPASRSSTSPASRPSTRWSRSIS